MIVGFIRDGVEVTTRWAPPLATSPAVGPIGPAAGRVVEEFGYDPFSKAKTDYRTDPIGTLVQDLTFLANFIPFGVGGRAAGPALRGPPRVKPAPPILNNPAPATAGGGLGHVLPRPTPPAFRPGSKDPAANPASRPGGATGPAGAAGTHPTKPGPRSDQPKSPAGVGGRTPKPATASANDTTRPSHRADKPTSLSTSGGKTPRRDDNSGDPPDAPGSGRSNDDSWASRYKLSSAENERIFRERIVPQMFDATSQRKPLLMILGGQTGAGKTATAAMLERVLRQRGNPIHVNMDFYNSHHPQFTKLRATDPANADAYLRPDGDRWWRRAQEYSASKRADVILESAMLARIEFEDILQLFRAAGYRTEVALMAVPAPMSRLGILDRFSREVREQGFGRMVSTADRGAADSIAVFRRGNVSVYSARKPTSGDWNELPESRNAVATERARPWTDQESLLFSRKYNELVRQLGPTWRDDLVQIAELAAPLLGPRMNLLRPRGIISLIDGSH